MAIEKISLELGSGGKMMRDFIDEYILKNFRDPLLTSLPDAARLPENLVFTTDSYVVDPLFFPGGDIGTLCVNGTVNDLVVSGAEPRYLSLGFILEEGLAKNDLAKIIHSIRESAKAAKVTIVTGDTKVVRRGQGDKIYINTAGIGFPVASPSPQNIKRGDKIIVTGTLGEHSLAVMLARGDFGLESQAESDCAPLNFLLPFWKEGILWMRDITRGGLATVLCELAESVPEPVRIDEDKIPLSQPVRGAAELLGIDPLYLACEGRAVLITPAAQTESILKGIKKSAQGLQAAVIGEIGSERGHPGELLLTTVTGGLRRLEPLTSELLPRIC